MTGLIEAGKLVAATDETMAYSINRPSASRTAVDARVRGVAVEVISDDPTILASAEAAMNDAADKAGFLKQVQLGAVRTLSVSDPLYAEVRLSYDFRRIGGSLLEGGEVGITPGTFETAIPGGSGVVEITRDYRRVDADSAAQSFTRLAGWGDSMIADNGMFPTQLDYIAKELGVGSYQGGRNGHSPQEIAWRAGAIAVRVSFPGGVLPASTPVAVTVEPTIGWRSAHTFDCVLFDIDGAPVNVRLSHPASAASEVPVWTATQLGGTAERRILSGARARFLTESDAARLPAVFWLGRNDPDAVRCSAAIAALLESHRDPARRSLVLPIFNRATEPRGSAGYETVMAANEAMRQVAGERWFDHRQALITHGLEIAGISPTEADETAIAEDRIPPSLMGGDATHLMTVPGRTALSRIISNEIKARKW